MSIISPLCLDGTLVELTLVGADGTRHDLVSLCEPYGVIQGETLRGVAAGIERGATVRGLAPWNVTSRQLGPDVPGETVTGVRAQARDIVVPLIIKGDTETLHENRLADLAGVLGPNTGPCRLIYKRADGTEREITCTYITGADDLRIENLATMRFTVANLRFRAHFPFWRQVDATHGESTGTFSNALFGDEDIFDVTNDGDVDTWPEITITGPAENIELANMTTGQVMRIIAELDVGDTARIVSDPAQRAAYFNEIARWDQFDPTQVEPWRLVPGVNTMVFRAIWPVAAVAGRTWLMRWPVWYQTS